MKRQHRMGTWLLCLCFFLPLTAHAQTTAKEWIEQGRAKHLKRDYAGAIADYTRALELDPANAGAYARRGDVLREKGNVTSALVDLNRAIELNPKEATAYASRGAARQAKRDYKGASADYDRAVELDPKYAWAYARRGSLKKTKKDVAGAMADLNRAIELDPKNVYAYSQRGFVNNARGRWDVAIADFTRVIELEPAKADGYFNRGQAKHNKRDYAGAIVDYDRAVELAPAYPYVYVNRGLANAWLDRMDAAIADYSRAIEVDPENKDTYVYRAYARTAKGDYDGAFADYARAGELDPESKPHYLHEQGDLRFKQRRFAEAYDYMSQAIPELRKQAGTGKSTSCYRNAVAVQFLSAWLSGKLNQLKPEELLAMMREQFSFLGILAWIVPIGLAIVLAGLVGWTYGTRKRGPGLWLSCTWIVVMLLASGIGFQLSLPGLNHMVERWLGAILVALACFTAVWVSGHERYLGARPWFANYKAWLYAAGLLLGLMVVVLVMDSGYEALYKRISGHKLDTQLAKFLMHCDTPRQLAFTVLVGGLLVPFYEEVLFRGFLLDALGCCWGTGWALGLTSVIFAVAHGLTLAPALVLFALVLGWLRIRTGNLRLCILLHGLNNSLAIIALYFEKA